MDKIPLIKPFLPEGTKERVCEVLDSGYLTEGPVTKELEKTFAEYIGATDAIAVCNCTVGLEVALRALGVGAGDEVVVSDYTYPATAAAVAIVGAKIVLVDVDPRTMLIDYDALESAISPKTKAVIPVSLFGNPLDYDRLNQIKSRHGVFIVEDAACSIGASFRGQKVGSLADISVFSLHPRKFITTGEGGIITTNDHHLANWMDSYKHFGMATVNAAREGICFERIGTNYKLSNILAAVGLEQMRHIDNLLERRRQLAARYDQLLASLTLVSLPSKLPDSSHSYQTYCIFVENRDQIMRSMRGKGIEVQIGTYALHRHPAFAQSESCQWTGKFVGSDYACDHALALPMFHEITKEQLERVVEELKAQI